ncbi:MAG TPA: hypothetical protein VIF62_27730, partial [Labilithrix sp.]
MKRRLVGTFASLVVVASACGREDVELAITPDGGVAVTDGGPEGNVLPEGGGEGGGACSDAGRTCRTLDDTCATDAECCSGRCEGDACVPSG